MLERWRFFHWWRSAWLISLSLVSPPPLTTWPRVDMHFIFRKVYHQPWKRMRWRMQRNTEAFVRSIFVIVCEFECNVIRVPTIVEYVCQKCVNTYWLSVQQCCVKRADWMSVGWLCLLSSYQFVGSRALRRGLGIWSQQFHSDPVSRPCLREIRYLFQVRHSTMLLLRLKL